MPWQKKRDVLLIHSFSHDDEGLVVYFFLFMFSMVRKQTGRRDCGGDNSISESFVVVAPGFKISLFVF